MNFSLRGILCGRETRPAGAASRETPKIWPLQPRSVLNSQELQVWRWLRTTFPEHFVAVKMPVTRFTLPLPGQNSKHLYRLLGGVYCTFALCRPDGHVVACVDLPGPRGLKQSNKDVKSALLGQCGIRFHVFDPLALPPQEEARVLLLGRSTASPPKASRSEVSDAQRRLRTSITQRRSGRSAAPQPEDSRFACNEWLQADSFIAPLDSRIGGLS